jgi:hypothetical protein
MTGCEDVGGTAGDDVWRAAGPPAAAAAAAAAAGAAATAVSAHVRPGSLGALPSPTELLLLAGVAAAPPGGAARVAAGDGAGDAALTRYFA